MLNDLFVIIPAYNEEKNIENVLKSLLGHNHEAKIIVVDDGSSDRTSEIAKKTSSSIIVIKHEVNLGKGAALKTGCEEAIKRSAKILALMDGDGQHLPADAMKLAEKLADENLDIVFGERKFNDIMPFKMKFGNFFLSFATKLLFNVNITDTQCGLRVFTSAAYEKIKWRKMGYSVETEIVINAFKNKLRCDSAEIETIYNDMSKGTGVRDGIKIFMNLLKWKFRQWKTN